MTRIRFDSETALNVPNLNKLNNVVISPTEPTTGEEVWIQKGKNLLSGIIENYTLDGNGGISAYNGYFVTEFIKVKPNTSYIASGFSTQHKEWYDEDFSLISNTGDNPAISPSNAKYLRMNGSTSSSSNMQIEQGSTATSYEPYIENKIYTKNDNGVYEEIYDEERINELSNENDASLLHQNYIGITPNTGSNYNGYGYSWYYKKGTKVHIHLGVQGLTPNTSNEITILPQGFRPKTPIIALGVGNGFGDIAYCQVHINGGIILQSNSQYGMVDVEYDAFS